MIRYHIIAHGKVQGVYFRLYTQKAANKIGLTGWVKNKPDGTVEIEVQGNKSKVEEFIQIVEQGPSPQSKVDHIDINEIAILEGEDTFKISY